VSCQGMSAYVSVPVATKKTPGKYNTVNNTLTVLIVLIERLVFFDFAFPSFRDLERSIDRTWRKAAGLTFLDCNQTIHVLSVEIRGRRLLPLRLPKNNIVRMIFRILY